MNIGPATSSAASRVACILLTPEVPIRLKCRVIFSSSTIESSTILPTPSANPPSVIMFRELPLNLKR